MKLPTASRSESMGLCFVGERGRFDKFLSQYIPARPGPILQRPDMTRVGTHNGLWTLTIGQNARIAGRPKKLFVAQKRASDNAIIVVDSLDHPALMCQAVRLKGWKWISEEEKEVAELDFRASEVGGMPVLTQIRHRMPPVRATLHKYSADDYEIRFEEALHGVAPGQVGAAWEGDWCLGCGEIVSTECLE